MLAFIQAKATELGAQNCPHCGQLDVGFGMSGNEGNGGGCINCKKSVPKYSSLKTMQFSLEVFRELVANYDDMRDDTADNRAFTSNMVGSLSNFLEPIQNNGRMPAASDIARLQAAMKTMDVAIGSEDRLGGAIRFNFGKPEIGFAKTIYKTSVTTLAVCTMAFIYIMKYPTGGATAKPASPEKKGFFSRWFS